MDRKKAPSIGNLGKIFQNISSQKIILKWEIKKYTKTPINAKNLYRIKWFLHLLVRLIFVEKTLKYP
jgi:hypothetical protein